MRCDLSHEGKALKRVPLGRVGIGSNWMCARGGERGRAAREYKEGHRVNARSVGPGRIAINIGRIRAAKNEAYHVMGYFVARPVGTGERGRGYGPGLSDLRNSVAGR